MLHSHYFIVLSSLSLFYFFVVVHFTLAACRPTCEINFLMLYIVANWLAGALNDWPSYRENRLFIDQKKSLNV